MKGRWPVLRRCMSSGGSTDALIVGGGPVGLSLACGLATHPQTRHMRVSLLDAQPQPRGQVEASVYPDARVLALAPSSTAFLQSCGVWNAVLESGRAVPYYDMHVMDARNGEVRFNAADAALPHLGFIVEHSVLMNALVARLEELCALSSGLVEVLPPAPFTTVASLPAHRVLLGCDGVQSAVRRAAGIPVWGWGYRQQALCTALRLQDPTFIGSSAVQRFTPQGGCVALLPALAGYVSVVYTVPSSAVSGLMALDGVALANVVADAVGPTLLGDLPRLVECVGPRGAPPLRLQTASSYTSERLALVGDAAHSVHPLAGQGLNLAFHDMSCLIEAFGWAFMTGSDVGGSDVLSRYERDAKLHDSAALAAVHGIWSTMQWNGAIFSPLRGLGMDLVSQFAPLRQMLVKQAAGVARMNKNTW